MTETGSTAVADKKKPTPKTTPVKLDSRLARKAKTIAEDKGIDLSDYLASITEGPIERDWKKVLKKIAEADEEDEG